MVYTVLIFASRKPGTTPQEFRDHYEGIHMPLVKELTGDHFPQIHRRRYIHRAEGKGDTERNPNHPATVLLGTQADFDYDVVGELIFPDATASRAFLGAMQNPETAGPINADAEKFVDIPQ